MAQVRMIDDPDQTGISNDFNVSALDEVIVHFDNDGGSDSMYISTLEVLIGGQWIPMTQAFACHDLIPNNTNTSFSIPMSAESRQRGYY